MDNVKFRWQYFGCLFAWWRIVGSSIDLRQERIVLELPKKGKNEWRLKRFYWGGDDFNYAGIPFSSFPYVLSFDVMCIWWSKSLDPCVLWPSQFECVDVAECVSSFSYNNTPQPHTSYWTGTVRASYLHGPRFTPRIQFYVNVPWQFNKFSFPSKVLVEEVKDIYRLAPPS
jgi:hypothetical protein